jgi:hypothetical protein
MFKVGDRVKLIRRGIPTETESRQPWSVDWPAKEGLKIGDTFTITAISNDGALQVGNIDTWMDPWYFERAEEKTLEPISYEGCHPEVARALRAGDMIRCRVWDSGCSTQITTQVIGYNAKYSKYCTLDGDFYYDNAEPFVAEYRVKTPRAILRALEKDGYEWDGEVWRSKMNPKVFRPEMFSCCGKKVERQLGDWKVGDWFFIEDWLEKV